VTHLPYGGRGVSASLAGNGNEQQSFIWANVFRERIEKSHGNSAAWKLKVCREHGPGSADGRHKTPEDLVERWRIRPLLVAKNSGPPTACSISRRSPTSAEKAGDFSGEEVVPQPMRCDVMQAPRHGLQATKHAARPCSSPPLRIGAATSSIGGRQAVGILSKRT